MSEILNGREILLDEESFVRERDEKIISLIGELIVVRQEILEIMIKVNGNELKQGKVWVMWIAMKQKISGDMFQEKVEASAISLYQSQTRATHGKLMKMRSKEILSYYLFF